MSALFVGASLTSACTSNAPNRTDAPTTDLDLSAASAAYGQTTFFSAIDCDKSAAMSWFMKSLGPEVTLATFVLGARGPSTVQVPTGVPVRMMYRYSRLAGMGSSGNFITATNAVCDTYWTFVPEKGHRYAAKGNECSSTLVDLGQNTPPASYHPNSRMDICPTNSEFTKAVLSGSLK